MGKLNFYRGKEYFINGRWIMATTAATNATDATKILNKNLKLLFNIKKPNLRGRWHKISTDEHQKILLEAANKGFKKYKNNKRQTK